MSDNVQMFAGKVQALIPTNLSSLGGHFSDRRHAAVGVMSASSPDAIVYIPFVVEVAGIMLNLRVTHDNLLFAPKLFRSCAGGNLPSLVWTVGNWMGTLWSACPSSHQHCEDT